MNIGSKHTEESKRKISESMKGKLNNPQWGGKKPIPVPVENVTLKKKYATMTEAAQSIGCSVTNIYNACIHISQFTAGGYEWKFL